MKVTKNQLAGKIILLIIIIFSFTATSCSEALCPSYAKSLQKVKSIQAKNTKARNTSTVPPPFNIRYMAQIKGK